MFVLSDINRQNYLQKMKNWFWPKRLRTEQYEKYIFQQDGERPHTTRGVQTWMKEKFGREFIA